VAYSDFTVESVQKTLGIQLQLGDLLPQVVRMQVPMRLRESIDLGLQVPLLNEKTRSEFIVAPILLAVREMLNRSFTILSGIQLNVDPERGLVGECDFILSAAPPLPSVQAPFVAVLEAKKADIEDSIGQCAAQMIGAKIFNERESRIARIMGCVTTGELWQFMDLDGSIIRIDKSKYYLKDLEELLGAWHVLLSAAIQSTRAAA
jgi:hypothetical protein